MISALAQRVGAEHPGFDMTAREIIDKTLQASGWGTIDALEENRWIDCQPDFDYAHYSKGFDYPDGKFRFKPDWENVPVARKFDWGIAQDMPRLPDHWDVIERADEKHPFRLATSPARGYLNSSFNETPTSRAQEGAPNALIHPDDLADLGIEDGARIRMGNARGEIELLATAFDGLKRGVVIVEGVKPNEQHADGKGINTLTSADAIAPYGGAAFHDNHVWIAGI